MPASRQLRITAAASALLAAYGAGLLSMALVNGGQQSASPSVLDQAEQRISSNAARPVSAAVLERAAVEGNGSSHRDCVRVCGTSRICRIREKVSCIPLIGCRRVLSGKPVLVRAVIRAVRFVDDPTLLEFAGDAYGSEMLHTSGVMMIPIAMSA